MLQALIWLSLGLSALSVVARVILWPVDSYRFQRLAKLHDYPRPWLAWVPFFRNHIVASSAGVGWLSWFLSQVPGLNVYVEWDWWDDIADDLKFRHTSFRALGIVNVPILRTVLIGGVVDKTAARSGPVRATTTSQSSVATTHVVTFGGHRVVTGSVPEG